MVPVRPELEAARAKQMERYRELRRMAYQAMEKAVAADTPQYQRAGLVERAMDLSRRAYHEVA